MSTATLRSDARAIWDAAVTAADAARCVLIALTTESARQAVQRARRFIVVGGGKAGALMAAGVEQILALRLDDVTGIVNVPTGNKHWLRSIRLHVARPAGTNEPTAEGVDGARQMLSLVAAAEPDDLVIALISGGGSALLPAPVEGVSLEDKQDLTRLLHRCGATIVEMNCVRKHLSRIKGGGLAAAAQCPVLSLIISDVIGDPIDAIASGPTAADSSTFTDAIAVLRKYRIQDHVPLTVRSYLEAGARGAKPETLKSLPASVANIVIANNRIALNAAEQAAAIRGYAVHNFGSEVDGETALVAGQFAAKLTQCAPRSCLLIGGETTVTLPPDHGKGGRNSEFVLAALIALESSASRNYVVLSGGTDGEDGPTDAAGAMGDATTLNRARALGHDPADFLRRHDSYAFFDATGDLIRTGLTQTNVMDVRVLLTG
jgi:hydroxypyruvate reductase/glycerate 2-kinase